MKKQIARGMVIMLGILAMLTGCTREEIPEYHGETEYFQYAYVWGEGSTGAALINVPDKQCYAGIGELTELGKEQKEIVIPKTIGGKPVKYLGYYIMTWYYPKNKGFQSNNLEKLYLPNTVRRIRTADNASLLSCPNLTVIIYNSILEIEVPTVDQYLPVNTKIFVPSKYKYVFDKSLYANAYKNKLFCANISYHLNYEGAENGGYWWIDNLVGESQLKAPEEPTREGYEFGGWYKESECVTAWNFDEDRTENEEIDEEGNVIFRETELYAKWLSKDAE